MPEDRSSKGLLTAIALVFLSPTITAFVNGGSPLDYHLFGPCLAAAVLLIVAYVPSVQAMIQARTAGQLERYASDVRVWFVLFAALWLYFAGWTLMYRYEQIVKAQPPIPPSTAQTERSEWSIPTSDEIQSLADKMSGITGVTITQIEYSDSQDEPFALAIAQAMHLAGWPEARIGQGDLILGTRVTVGRDIVAAGNVVRSFIAKKTGDQPSLRDNINGTIYVTIGRPRPK
jgi:hypothetical protein